MAFKIRNPRQSPAPGPMDCGGRVFATLFGLVFFSAGALFAAFIGREAWKDVQTRRWTPTECAITDSRVVSETDADGGYRFEVRYTYRASDAGAVEGRPFTGTAFRRGQQSVEDDYRDAVRLAEQFPAGARATCYVNPVNPAEAILRHKSPWYGLTVLFPLLFCAVGAGVVLLAWHDRIWGRNAGRAESGDGSEPDPARPISKAAASTGRGATVGLCLLFGVFLVVGVLGSYVFLLDPLADMLSARSWPAAQAKVVQSRVLTHSGDDGSTYSVDVLYEYEFDGRPYRSNRYRFFGGSSSGYEAKRALAARLPPGAALTCYVNPRDPTEAVVERGFTGMMLLGLIPLVFALVGGVGLVFTIRHRGRSKGGGTGPRSDLLARTGREYRRGGGAAGRSTLAPPPAADGTVTLKPRESPLKTFVGAAVFAAFWNGIVGGFFFAVFRGGLAGSSGNLCPMLFLTPFALIGLLLIGFVGYSFLRLFAPRPVVTLGRGELSPGAAGEIRWTFAGRHHRIKRLVVSLEGREEATYRRGTTTSTDKHTFFRHDIVQASRDLEIRSGRAEFRIPPGTMHSWSAGNNRIVWELAIRGEIPLWPDVKEQFELTVLPVPLQALRHAEGLPPAAGDMPADLPAPGSAGADRLLIQPRGLRTSYRPGETVEGDAAWDLQFPAESVEVRLIWYTRGKGTTDVEVVEARSFPAAGRKGRGGFRFVVPAEQPYSFSGRLISVIWALELIVEPGERSRRVDLIVSPTGGEIDLSLHAAPDTNRTQRRNDPGP